MGNPCAFRASEGGGPLNPLFDILTIPSDVTEFSILVSVVLAVLAVGIATLVVGVVLLMGKLGHHWWEGLVPGYNFYVLFSEARCQVLLAAYIVDAAFVYGYFMQSDPVFQEFVWWPILIGVFMFQWLSLCVAQRVHAPWILQVLALIAPSFAFCLIGILPVRLDPDCYPWSVRPFIRFEHLIWRHPWEYDRYARRRRRGSKGRPETVDEVFEGLYWRGDPFDGPFYVEDEPYEGDLYEDVSYEDEFPEGEPVEDEFIGGDLDDFSVEGEPVEDEPYDDEWLYDDDWLHEEEPLEEDEADEDEAPGEGEADEGGSPDEGEPDEGWAEVDEWDDDGSPVGEERFESETLDTAPLPRADEAPGQWPEAEFRVDGDGWEPVEPMRTRSRWESTDDGDGWELVGSADDWPDPESEAVSDMDRTRPVEGPRNGNSVGKDQIGGPAMRDREPEPTAPAPDDRRDPAAPAPDDRVPDEDRYDDDPAYRGRGFDPEGDEAVERADEAEPSRFSEHIERILNEEAELFDRRPRASMRRGRPDDDLSDLVESQIEGVYAEQLGYPEVTQDVDAEEAAYLEENATYARERILGETHDEPDAHGYEARHLASAVHRVEGEERDDPDWPEPPSRRGAHAQPGRESGTRSAPDPKADSGASRPRHASDASRRRGVNDRIDRRTPGIDE